MSVSPRAAVGRGGSPTSPSAPALSGDNATNDYFNINQPILRLDTIHEHVKVEPVMAPVRRPSSISFRPAKSETSVERVPLVRKPSQIRELSPPAPDRFERRVSFDNFGGGEATEHNTIAFTLNVKHTGYSYNKRSRTFMVGIDEHDYSDTALKWMLDELVDDGDEIVCVRVVDKDAKISSDKSMEKKQYQDEALMLMENIQAKNAEHRAISIVLEFAVGKLHTTFQKMIQIYEPGMLIVGTKGRSLGGFQGLMSNRTSFSKWCLQYSPIPVVVVRPDEKREKKKLKRKADPTRQSYHQLLQDSGSQTHETSRGPDGEIIAMDGITANAPDEEAHAVAAALGLPSRFDPTIKRLSIEETHPLRKIQSGRSDVTSGTDSRASSPGVPKRSPKLATMESPAVSDGEDLESEDEEGEEGEEGEFEAVPGHMLLGEDGVKKERLHQMEVGEAAALAGRKASIGSSASGDYNDDDDR